MLKLKNPCFQMTSGQCHNANVILLSVGLYTFIYISFQLDSDALTFQINVFVKMLVCYKVL